MGNILGCSRVPSLMKNKTMGDCPICKKPYADCYVIQKIIEKNKQNKQNKK